MAKQSKAGKPTKPVAVAEEDSVRVRALLRGFDGLIIRNAGEVFHLPTSAMSVLPDGVPVPVDDERKPRLTFESEGVTYLLPRWCVPVGEHERVTPDDEQVKGHKTAFRPGDEDVI